jgi:predicted nucleic acid-binding protein
MFLLDTNVISEVRKGRRSDSNVSNWYTGVGESQLYISSLTIGEIRKGIELARRRHDVDQAEALEAWLHTVVNGFSGRVLTVDAQVADTWGQMSAIRPIPVVDALLAATAQVHDLILVTRNVSDVEGLGVKVLNPFLYLTGGNGNA